MGAEVFVYSRGGKTRALAAQAAQELRAPLREVREAKPRSLPGTLIRGAVASRRGDDVPLEPVPAPQAAFVLLACPVWAGLPAAPMQSFVRGCKLQGKTVFGVMTSGGGNAKAVAALTALIKAAGGACAGVIDVAGGGLNALKADAAFAAFLKDGSA